MYIYMYKHQLETCETTTTDSIIGTKQRPRPTHRLQKLLRRFIVQHLRAQCLLRLRNCQQQQPTTATRTATTTRGWRRTPKAFQTRARVCDKHHGEKKNRSTVARRCSNQQATNLFVTLAGQTVHAIDGKQYDSTTSLQKKVKTHADC